MRKKLQSLFFLFVFGILGANAQPIITAEGFNPQVGDKIKRQNAKISSVISPDSGGANRVWDYSNLKDSGAISVINVISPEGLPYVDSFPTANMAAIFDTTSFEYWQTSNKGWGQVGNYYKSPSGSIMLNRANSIVNYIVYPMSYKKVYTDSISINFNNYDGNFWPQYIYTQYDTLNADGYGTLKLPGVTYNNVLRVFSHSGTSSSSFGSGIYFFYANGIHFPLLVLSSNTSYNNGIETIASWNAQYYKGNALPIEISSFTTSWQNKHPLLQWNATNTENTKQFNIQRSTDGRSFTTVGKVGVTKGAAYHFEDDYLPKSIVYYRLQQIDKTGAAFYSNTTLLAVNQLQFSVFPNPTKGSIHLSLATDAKVQVLVYDVTGKLVYNNTNFSSTDAIATDSWTKGTYLVKIKDAIGWKTSSFEKQ